MEAKMITVSLFNGHENIDDFVADIDRASQALKFTNPQTANFAMMRIIRGSVADIWMKAAIEGSMVNASCQNMNLWLPEPAQPMIPAVAAAEGIQAEPEIPAIPLREGGLRLALTTEYGKETNSFDIAELRKGLIQKKEESVKEFYNRCVRTHQIIDKGVFGDKNLRTDENRVWHTDYHKKMVGADFLTGVHLPIKAAIISYGAKTLPEYIEAATNFEKGMVVVKNGHNGNNHNGHNGHQRVLAAESSGSHSQTQNQGAAPNHGADVQVNAVAKSTKQCHYCGLVGHLVSVCKFKKRDVEAGITLDRHADYPLKPKGKGKSTKKSSSSAGAHSATASAISSIKEPTTLCASEIEELRRYREQAWHRQQAQHPLSDYRAADPFASMGDRPGG